MVSDMTSMHWKIDFAAHCDTGIHFKQELRDSRYPDASHNWLVFRNNYGLCRSGKQQVAQSRIGRGSGQQSSPCCGEHLRRFQSLNSVAMSPTYLVPKAVAGKKELTYRPLVFR